VIRLKFSTLKLFYFLSLFSLTIFLVGFVWTLQNHLYPNKSSNIAMKETKVVAEMNKEDMTIIALGDSLTRGTGDSEGKGYIGYLMEELDQKTKEKTTIQNLAVKGFRTEQLYEQLQTKSVKSNVQKADIILITIGGNDLFQSGQTVLDLNLSNVDKLREQYLINLEKIVLEIRQVNKEAIIYFVGLYNPFIDFNDAAIMTQAVRQWNFSTSELLDKYPLTVFVPTFDLFQLSVNDYLYSDKFHPNSEGYRLIAERVASLINW
jgi:lysophospholipase L1-like esterase